MIEAESERPKVDLQDAAAALAAAGLPVEWAPHVRSAGKVRILLDIPRHYASGPGRLCSCGKTHLSEDEGDETTEENP